MSESSRGGGRGRGRGRGRSSVEGGGRGSGEGGESALEELEVLEVVLGDGSTLRTPGEGGAGRGSREGGGRGLGEGGRGLRDGVGRGSGEGGGRGLKEASGRGSGEGGACGSAEGHSHGGSSEEVRGSGDVGRRGSGDGARGRAGKYGRGKGGTYDSVMARKGWPDAYPEWVVGHDGRRGKMTEAMCQRKYVCMNKEIMDCKDAWEILDLCDARLSEFNQVNVVTAFHRIAKHEKGRQQQE